MRLPRMRFTICCGIALIAAIAMACYASVLAARSREFAALAAEHASDEGWYGMKADKLQGFIAGDLAGEAPVPSALASASQPGADAPPDARLAAWRRDYATYRAGPRASWLARGRDAYRARADFHRAMARKYRGAARRPWIGVAPDPPEPPLDPGPIPEPPRSPGLLSAPTQPLLAPPSGEEHGGAPAAP